MEINIETETNLVKSKDGFDVTHYKIDVKM